MVICLERGAYLHITQLIPLPLTISCSNKSRLVHLPWVKKTDWVKKYMEYEVEGARPRGRFPKKTWREIVEKDCQMHKLNRENAMDHIRWMKQIRDD